MISLIKEYLDDYLRFWPVLGAAVLRPIQEISYRVRHDSGYRRSVMFLGAALLTNALLITLVAGQSLSDLSRIVILCLNAAVLSLLGFISFALAWKICGYKGDTAKLMRMGFYFNGIYITIITVVLVLYYGAFKVISPKLYNEYLSALRACEGGFCVKVSRLSDLTTQDPLIDTLYSAQVLIITSALLFYWGASIRLYFALFPMGRLRGTLAFMLALVFWLALLPLDWLFLLAIGENINGC